jgi:hypothetical protein
MARFAQDDIRDWECFVAMGVSFEMLYAALKRRSSTVRRPIEVLDYCEVRVLTLLLS